MFNFTINYNKPQNGATPLFNGNISETSWNTLNVDTSTKSYSYKYDAMNRLLSAIDNTTDNRYSLLGVTYDKNGNIQTLKRNGHRDINATSFGLMDNLKYTYANNNTSNKLIKVEELTGGSAITGFKDGINTSTEYMYDANGNLVRDLNKGIGTSSVNGITYNHLNLPLEIKVNNSSTKKINYTYASDGTKLRKVVNDNGNITTTDYANGYIYKNNVLQMFPHPEGYVEYDGSSDFKYVYSYVDHNGNVRLNYADLNNNGSIEPESEILDEKSYYAFGLEHRGSNPNVIGTENNFQTFNGKELNQDLDFNMLEMDVRQYDPAIARWISMDPVIHPEYSPYQAFDNNPVFWSDPTGADGEHYNFKTKRYENDEGDEVTFGEAMASVGLNTDGSEKSDDNSGGCDDCSKCPETCNKGKTAKSESKYKVSVDTGGMMETSLATGLAISRVDGPLKVADVFGGAYILNTMLLTAAAQWTAGKVNDAQASILLSYDANWLYAKQDKEIQRILSKAGGPPGMTYALLVNVSGNYIDVRGNSVYLNSGDVWKYGETTKGIDGRYSRSQLDNMIPGGVRPQPLFFGNMVQIKVQEKIMIYGHALKTGKLPPGNKIFR